jgi:hypothetical protein
VNAPLGVQHRDPAPADAEAQLGPGQQVEAKEKGSVQCRAHGGVAGLELVAAHDLRRLQGGLGRLHPVESGHEVAVQLPAIGGLARVHQVADERRAELTRPR